MFKSNENSFSKDLNMPSCHEPLPLGSLSMQYPPQSRSHTPPERWNVGQDSNIHAASPEKLHLPTASPYLCADP